MDASAAEASSLPPPLIPLSVLLSDEAISFPEPKTRAPGLRGATAPGLREESELAACKTLASAQELAAQRREICAACSATLSIHTRDEEEHRCAVWLRGVSKPERAYNLSKKTESKKGEASCRRPGIL